MKKILFLSLLLLLSFPAISFAHGGRTDSSGGHYTTTGEYHYHHGYSAHIHYHTICPYDVAEIAYDTSYPWSFESFLDEYVQGFECGYDIGAWYGEEDGYHEYYKSNNSFDCETEYEFDDYDSESPYVYGYCDGYRFGYCIEFEEAYNNESSYNNSDKKYKNWEIDEVWLYANHETTDVLSSNSPSSPSQFNKNDSTQNEVDESNNGLLHKIKVFFVEPVNSVGDSRVTLLIPSLFCLCAIICILGGLMNAIGSISSLNTLETTGKKIAKIGLCGLVAPVWALIFVCGLPLLLLELFSKKRL